MKRFPKLGTTCPHCQQPIKRLKTKGTYSFCPHCDILLYTKPKPKKPLSTQKKIIIAMLVALITFIPLLQSNYPEYSPLIDSLVLVIFKIFLGLLVLATVIFIYLRNYAVGEYIAGVDTFSDMEKFLCEYSYDARNQQCPNCDSFKMTGFLAYRNSLTMNDKEICNIDVIKDNQQFVGCIHCSAQFEHTENESKIFIFSMCFLLIWNIMSAFFKTYIIELVEAIFNTLNPNMTLILFKCLISYIFFALLVFVCLNLNVIAKDTFKKITYNP